MPAAEISSVLASVSALKDLGIALVRERDRHKASAIEADFTKRLLEVQTDLLQVLGAVIEKERSIHALEHRVRELETEQSERDRYRLAHVGTVGHFFAYQLRPALELSTRVDEPAHFLCQPCFDADKKSVLHLRGAVAICPICKRSVQIEPLPPAPPMRSASPRGIGGRDW